MSIFLHVREKKIYLKNLEQTGAPSLYLIAINNCKCKSKFMLQIRGSKFCINLMKFWNVTQGHTHTFILYFFIHNREKLSLLIEIKTKLLLYNETNDVYKKLTETSQIKN